MVRVLRAARRKLEKSLSTRGLLGTVRFAFHAASRGLRNRGPERSRSRAIEREDREFDRKYAVDTAGVISLSELSIDAPSWVFGNRYQAVGSSVDFVEVLGNLSLRYEEFTFVDLGSGKGRAILLASLLPFKKVTGLEFSSELHAIAQENLRRWPDHLRKCQQVELLCLDASDYEFPHEPLIVFMYNPFGQSVMDRIIANLTLSFRQQPRRTIVVYFTPRHSNSWDEVPFLERVRAQPGYHVYDTRVAALKI